jgi:hypothetical protein
MSKGLGVFRSSSRKDGRRLETSKLRAMWLNAEAALKVTRAWAVAAQTGTTRAAKPGTLVNSIGNGGSGRGKVAPARASRSSTALTTQG